MATQHASAPALQHFGEPGRIRFKLTIAYDGTFFHGWQKQEPPGKGPLRTVAGIIEDVLVQTLQQPIALVGAPAVILATTGFIEGLTIPIYNINQVSLRQAITPDRVQGRMNATMRTIVWGTIPLGAFIGGILGTSIGLVQTIVLGGILSTLAASWIFLGPVIRLREQPTPVMA